MTDYTINHMTAALCLAEHIADFPHSEFAKVYEGYRSANGSWESRDRLASFARVIEEAHDLASMRLPEFRDLLQDRVGCWDFAAIPRVADHFADSWLDVGVDTVATYLLALANPAQESAYEVTVHYTATVVVTAKGDTEAMEKAQSRVTPDLIQYANKISYKRLS